MVRYKVQCVFTEQLLGTVPKDKEVYAKWVATQANDEQLVEELETIQEVEESGWTGFHQIDEEPYLYDYVIKGFFKEACWSMRNVPDSLSGKLGWYKKKIDALVFVEPRLIAVQLNGGAMGIMERPLRAETAKGPRTALARSDTCPPGSSIEFTVTILGQISRAMLEEWLRYGQWRGLGQWRNANWGRFTYTLEPC